MKNIKIIYPCDNTKKKIKLTTTIPSNKKIEVLVLSGGGVKGLCHVGVAKCLENLNILEHVHTFVGTSVGAFIAALLYMGYSADEIEAFSMKLNFNLLKETDLHMFLELYGMDNGTKIDYVIKTLIKMKYGNDIITLNEIYNITKKKFIAVTTCVETGKTHYIDYTTHPDLPLHLSIKMSLSIPFIFCPVQYNNCHFVDGGVTCNFPIEIFSDNIEQVLGVYLTNVQNFEPIKTIKDYTIKLMMGLSANVTDELLEKYANNIIIIKLQDIGVIDFSISDDQKKQMCAIGYSACIDKLCYDV